MRISDWSSDVCSSDLVDQGLGAVEPARVHAGAGDRRLLKLVSHLQHRRGVQLPVRRRWLADLAVLGPGGGHQRPAGVLVVAHPAPRLAHRPPVRARGRPPPRPPPPPRAPRPPAPPPPPDPPPTPAP